MLLVPLTLYIHIPWCVRKCPYCDFNSHEATASLDEDAYVDALLRDLDFELPLAGDRSLQSIFIGGGTPSLFSGRAITRLLRGVAERIDFVEDIEITLEANPGTADAGHFYDYRQAGVNRLSIGAQSLSTEQLKKLGRIHDPGQIEEAFQLARQAGFGNINLDLMFGLPGQSTAAAKDDLQQGLALQPEHLSWYQLTLEPNTRFHRFPPALPDDDATAEIQQQGQSLLATAGFRQYEVSAYARENHRCRHNLNYWSFGDYLGIGAGAHGKISAKTGIQRRWRVKNPRDYLQKAGTAAGISGHQRLEVADLGLEFMLNALRLNDGVPVGLFSERTGSPLSSLSGQLQFARERGLLSAREDRLQATELGFSFLNDLVASFDEPGVL